MSRSNQRRRDRPTVTALADSPIATGHAVRGSEPGARRVVRLVTDAGRGALAAAGAIRADPHARALTGHAGYQELTANLAAAGPARGTRHRGTTGAPVAAGTRR